MGAIAYHKTGTTDGAWDGPANVGRLKSADSKNLLACHAWYDASSPDTDKDDGYPDAKSAYKLPHHEVSADGTSGAANTHACSAAIAALNGGRGGVDIPDSDRHAVWSHLAHHLRDAGMTPPELKSLRASDGVERRDYPVEMRATTADGKSKIEGHAAVFNQLSEPIGFFGMFREQIQPGAFKKTISEADVRALFNHNPDHVLGRNKAGTLRLSEDTAGLAFDVDLPDTQVARDLTVSIDRGDISQCSFGFQVVKDQWQLNNSTDPNDAEGNMDIRTLIEVKLFDVSPVTYPAYPQTDVGVRALLSDSGLPLGLISAAVRRSYQGIVLTDEQRDAIFEASDYLRQLVEPSHQAHSARRQQPEPPQPGHSMEMLRRRLELAARN